METITIKKPKEKTQRKGISYFLAGVGLFVILLRFWNTFQSSTNWILILIGFGLIVLAVYIHPTKKDEFEDE